MTTTTHHGAPSTQGDAPTDPESGQLVHIDNVTKQFGSHLTLNEVSLSIGTGELIALLGPSGCGKTTLLRILAGLARPDTGRIVIDGHDVTDQPPQRRPIGMVFQSYALFPNLTVAGNIAFGLRVRKVARRACHDRVDELLDLVDLSGLHDRYPSELSGGQRQRVALARALATEPRLLLLDEPLSALDAVIRESLRDEIRRIQQRVGITAVYVTHDQAEAMAIADRVAVMRDGRIDEIGTPRGIYEHPRTTHTASFVGSRNLLTLPTSPEGHVAWGHAFRVPVPPDLVGGSVLAAFRPADVHLTDGHGMPGVVEVRVFLGTQTRLHIRAGDAAIAVDVDNDHADKLPVGSTVTLAVPPERVAVFPT